MALHGLFLCVHQVALQFCYSVLCWYLSVFLDVQQFHILVQPFFDAFLLVSTAFGFFMFLKDRQYLNVDLSQRCLDPHHLVLLEEPRLNYKRLNLNPERAFYSPLFEINLEHHPEKRLRKCCFGIANLSLLSFYKFL